MESVSIRLSNIKMNGEIRGTDAELQQLKESMRDLKQLQDIVLNSKHEILAGRRRVMAAKQLGWTHIRAVIAPNLDSALKALRAQRDENSCRLDTTRKEKLELARQLEEIENPEAAKRKAAAQAKKNAGKVGAGKLPAPEKGRVRDKVAEAIGMKGQTYERWKAVNDAAQQAPERYLDLAERAQDDKQPIDPIHKEFRARKQIYEAADSDPRYQDIADTLTFNHDTPAAFAAYESRRDEQSRDKLGTPLPKGLRKVFSDQRLREFAGSVDMATAQIDDVTEKLGKFDLAHLERARVRGFLDGAIKMLSTAYGLLIDAHPYAVCPKCSGKTCKTCGKSGWLTKSMYDQLQRPT